MGEDERKLYVGNLPAEVAEEEVREVFGLYGNIAEVHINFPKDGSRNTRSAFVRFEESQDAAAAMAVLSDMYKFRETSAPIRVNVARPAWGSSGKALGGKGANGVAHTEGGNSYGGCEAAPANPVASAGTAGTGAPVTMPPPVATPPPPAATPARATGGNPLTTPPPPAPSSGWNSGGVTQNGGGGNQWNDGYGRAQANGRQWGGGPYAGDSRDPITGRDLAAKLWVGNLPGDSNREMIEELFKTYGQVEEVSILPNKSRSGQVCAFVHYATPAQADACIQVMASGYELRPGEGELKVERPSTRGKGGYGGDKGKGKKGYQPY